MGLFYGLTTQEELRAHIRRACEIINPENVPVAMKFLLEIAAAETAMASIRDVHFAQGKGVFQFDSVGFEDVQSRTKESVRIRIIEDMALDILRHPFSCLDTSPLLCAVFCRLKIMLIPHPIPTVREERAKMWKKYYNSAAGKGTIEHYLKQSRIFLGDDL